MFHQRFGVFVEVGGEGDFALEDVSVDAHGIFVVEGVDSSVHFIDQNSESPPVDCFSVTLVQNNFRSDVFWSSADGEGSAFGQKLGESEVCEFEVAVVADEKVFWFQISEDDVFAVEVFEAAGDGCPVEAGLVGGEGLDVAEIGEELSAVDKFEDEVKVSGVLGESFEGDDEGVIDL